MATKAYRLHYLELFLLVFVACMAQPAHFQTTPALSLVETWAKKLDAKFNTIALDSTASRILTSKYNQYYSDGKMSFGEVNSMDLVTEMSEKLTKMLGGKMEALRRSVNVAEAAAANHSWDSSLKLGNVDYWNSKDPVQLKDHLEYSDRFKQKINTTRSSVHIPVELYEGDIDILNGLMWSHYLDGIFEDNYKQDENILWQYFGSQTGFMRTFPGSLWTTPDDEVDLYDVRRRPWYTQGSSSPKDMLILIDRSGSVHGKTLQLVKVAVKSILDTLGENDFVQIIKFSTDADYVSCFKTFVQANYRNKKILGEAVDSLTANGMANFKIGLKFAFEQFEKFEAKNSSKSGEGADCNKMIMLLTDGGTDMAEKVFKERNWGRPQNRRIRVFTYAVGQTANPVNDIRWMACANRGRFSEIPAMGAIRAKVQEYVDVIARPLAIKHIELEKWTSSYLGLYRSTEYMPLLVQTKANLNIQDKQWRLTFDPREYVPVLSRPQALQNKKLFKFGNIYQDGLGLGMMTTVTLPVYNRTTGASNQTILGVMGIDVTTAQMEQFSPKWKLGPNGYTFAINTNGYVIFHPLLKIDHYLKDPPNMDFLDLEVESDSTIKLRKDMIEHKESTMKIDTYVESHDERIWQPFTVTPPSRRNGALNVRATDIQLSSSTMGTPLHFKVKVDEQEQRHVDVVRRNYSYTVINGTNFSLGISLPLDQKRFPQMKGDACKLSDTNFTMSEVLIAPWEYYEGQSKENLTGTLFDLIKMLKLNMKCEDLTYPDGLTVDEEKIKHLHWDIQMVKHFENYWKDMTRGDQQSEIRNRTSDNDTTANNTEVVAHFLATIGGLTLIYPKSEAYLLENDRDPWEANYFRRSLNTNKSMFSAQYTLDKRNVNESVPYIRITRSIEMDVDTDIYKPAVSGVFVSHDKLLDVFYDTIDENKVPGTLTCREDAELVCYLLDDGAFLLATNQKDRLTEIGRFFGHIDAGLMSALYNRTYQRLEQYDYQAICERDGNGSNSAAPLSFRIPSINLLFDLLTVNWFSTFWTWTTFNFNFFSWLSPQTHAASIEVEEVMTMEEDTDSCIKRQAQYYFSDKPGTGSIKDTIYPCNSNCTRDFFAVRFEKTNLLLLVASPECPDCEATAVSENLVQEPRRDPGPEFCEMEPRYRNNPEKCYDYDAKEDTTKCSGPHSRPMSITVIAIATTVSIISAFMFTDR